MNMQWALDKATWFCEHIRVDNWIVVPEHMPFEPCQYVDIDVVCRVCERSFRLRLDVD